jgi:hypothetical protein
MARLQRDEMVTLRVSKDERGMLEALTADEGLSGSDVLRQLLRAAYRKKFGGEKPPRVKRKP